MSAIPAELVDLLTTDVVGHAAFVAPDGSLRTAIVWVDFDGEHVLTSSPVGSYKGGCWRNDPRVAISIADREDPWRSLSISGRLIDIGPDDGLVMINRLSQRYRGGLYPFTGVLGEGRSDHALECPQPDSNRRSPP
jgi:Pyridoxamine 5'-phosphate oxidase